MTVIRLQSYITFEVRFWQYGVSMEYDEDRYRKKKELYSKELRLFGLAEHMTWFMKKKRASELIVSLDNDDYELLESDLGERLNVGHITHHDPEKIDGDTCEYEYEFEICLKENIFSDLYQNLLEFSKNMGRRKKGGHSMFISLTVIGFDPAKRKFFRIEPETWDHSGNINIIGFNFALHSPPVQ